MQLLIATKALAAELALLKKVAEKKNTIPALTYALAVVTDHKLRLTATDLDVTLDSTIKAEVYTPGTFLFPLAALEKTVKAIKTQEVELEYRDGGETDGESTTPRLIVRAGKFEVELPCDLAVENFPTITRVADGALGFGVGSHDFGAMIARALPFITLEESRYTLSGAEMQVIAGRLALVATDGHRLAIADTACHAAPEKGKIKKNTIVHSKALKVLADLCKHPDSDGARAKFGFRWDAPTDVHVKDLPPVLAGFAFPNRVLTTRLCKGQFPNYEMVIPKSLPVTALFDGADCLESLKRITSVVKTRSMAAQFTLAGNLLISAAGEDYERARDVVTASVDVPAGYAYEKDGRSTPTPEPYVGFNMNYVMDFLKIVKGDVLLAMKDDASQVQMTPASGEGFRYILMPLRL